VNLLLVTDDLFEAHHAPRPHPERPERLRAVREQVRQAKIAAASAALRPATDEELCRVHAPAYLAELSSIRGESGWLDADTFYSPETYDAVLAAAGAAVDCALAALAGSARGLALVRPPGHHAESDRAMGFCLINNVAVAAAAARAAGAERVAVIDWDVHHGNGTQHIFEADPSVLFVSVHQYPFYPGTGAASEIGRDDGEGATINVGLPAGCGDADYRLVMDRIVSPALRAYRPDVVLVSAGFDAAATDPLANMRVTTDGFRDMAACLRQTADEVCEGRIAAVLEGGYDLGGLSAATTALAEVLAADRAPAVRQVGATPCAGAQKAVFATLAAHESARNRWLSDVGHGSSHGA